MKSDTVTGAAAFGGDCAVDASAALEDFCALAALCWVACLAGDVGGPLDTHVAVCADGFVAGSTEVRTEAAVAACERAAGDSLVVAGTTGAEVLDGACDGFGATTGNTTGDGTVALTMVGDFDGAVGLAPGAADFGFGNALRLDLTAVARTRGCCARLAASSGFFCSSCALWIGDLPGLTTDGRGAGRCGGDTNDAGVCNAKGSTLAGAVADSAAIAGEGREACFGRAGLLAGCGATPLPLPLLADGAVAFVVDGAAAADLVPVVPLDVACGEAAG